MKKLLTILLLTILSVSAFSQTLIFRVDKAISVDLETEKEEVRDDISFLIHFNIDDGVISIDNELKSKYCLDNSLGEEKKKDSNNREYVEHTFSAFDEDNLRCTVYLQIYTDYNLTIFMVEYKDLFVAWRTKCINK